MTVSTSCMRRSYGASGVPRRRYFCAAVALLSPPRYIASLRCLIRPAFHPRGMAMRKLSVLFALFLSGASPAFAQFDTATVVGTVRDTSGAVIAGAKVTLTSAGTGISVVKTSTDDGNFEFAAVRPGRYLVTGEKAGFALALVDNIEVQVGARMRVDLQMPVGQITEKVEVAATSPLIETDSSQRGQVITGDQTRALPLSSREYSTLALLTTGVKLAGSSLTTGN